MLKPKPFKGASVFMSRNLVAPEIFDALLDALKLNGAEVFLCCDPSRTGPSDFHVISSSDHEKFEDLRAKGCNLLGPQCVLSCAKENRALPKQGFTCCLAMDGVKVLASGFDMDEKVKIEKLVTAMGGVLQTKASLDVNFVIVKNVLAAKYKWALNTLKKPIVTINWLSQCWNEHRVVPQESYRVLPFSGLMICVTRIPADKRKEIEKLIIQNGGNYSPELTKKCTHLICDAPEGDKYKVAQRWGHIHIVNRKWFDQSVARRACLNEESYTVQGGSISSNKSVRSCLTVQCKEDKGIGNSLPSLSSMASDSNVFSVPSTRFEDQDIEATLSQHTSSIFVDASVSKEVDSDAPTVQTKTESNPNNCVADDSQSEDNDLYLSKCRISLVGFEASEMRKLVNMVRRGGGSRYVSCNSRLTHIIVGTLSEVEKREVRSLAALGVIQVVKTSWLEDCIQERKEVPVLQKHVAYDLLLPKDSVWSTNEAQTCMKNLNQGKKPCVFQSTPADQMLQSVNPGIGIPLLEETRAERPKINLKSESSLDVMEGSSRQSQLPTVKNRTKSGQKMKEDPSVQNLQNRKSSMVFRGKTFCFSDSFPEDRRAEIVQWVNQGGGEVLNDQIKHDVHFTVECHGRITVFVDASHTTFVSSHWIHSCLEDGCLLDVGSHILYSPLSCQIPLPGFEKFRFCVSQYEDKDRMLLRNLCFVLGAKFIEKLTKKVTHLLCKFASGPKYEAACRWGILTVTSEWIYECVRQNGVVSLDPFCPTEVTAHDREAGLCTVSQFPTQAFRMVSTDEPSQLTISSQDRRALSAEASGSKNDSTICNRKASGSKNDSSIGNRNDSLQDASKKSNNYSKRARISEDEDQRGLLSVVHLSDPVSTKSSSLDNISKDDREVSHVPDVAAVIEDILEQTSKIQDLNLPETTGRNKSLYSSDCSVLGQNHTDSPSVIGLSRQWLNRTVKKDDACNPSGDVNVGIYDGFSETQTESQVVGYEEDLSGMQMLIDKVRTRSSMT
ncbi:DNA topoisomerase 2-binding protein 1-A-like isoform X1 [Mangifera indica]|uniref:DNA topoisomerase 2-binding protein 1-A-like isoform X1 n=2 Tax=Mangifera indica TaxID=29780 RepID=UPI001CFAC901|nr:DNA topoisomerase 2-binding protein 1-A-like isoform X1 [Mangifera indica]